MITYITYSIANHYYMRYLQRNRKTCKLRTGNRKLKSVITLTSQFQQVVAFSLFPCVSTVQQTKRRRALSGILTHSDKTEMVYQVMRKIAGNVCTYTPIPPYPYKPIDPKSMFCLKFGRTFTLLTYSGYLHYNLGCIARNKRSFIQC
jgi:hypothetical protein